MKKLFTKGTGLILTALCILCANTVFSASNYSYDISTKQYSSLQGSVTYVPVGTKTSAILSQTLDSKTLSEGTSVYATLNKDFSYNSINIAPAGSTINGTVVKCKKAGIGNRNGQIQVRFTNIRTPQGYNIPVSAMIATTDGTGVLKGGSHLDSAQDDGKHAGVGAAEGA